jgi:hypothetical protein
LILDRTTLHHGLRCAFLKISGISWLLQLRGIWWYVAADGCIDVAFCDFRGFGWRLSEDWTTPMVKVISLLRNNLKYPLPRRHDIPS